MKKSRNQIEDYYRKSNVVHGYDVRRFKGSGGSYIQVQEIAPILELYTLISNKTTKTLELGAGRGRLTRYLAQINANIFCLERSSAMINILKSIVPSSNIFHQSVFDPIRTKGTFDVITSLRFFEHFSIEDQNKIFSNLKATTHKTGYVIYAGVNANSLEGFLTKFFPYGRYNYYYSSSELEKLFKSQHLEIEKKIGRFFLPRGAFLYLSNPLVLTLAKFVDTLLTRLAPGLCAYQVYLLKAK